MAVIATTAATGTGSKPNRLKSCASPSVTITVRKDGPYLVSGPADMPVEILFGCGRK